MIELVTTQTSELDSMACFSCLLGFSLPCYFAYTLQDIFSLILNLWFPETNEYITQNQIHYAYSTLEKNFYATRGVYEPFCLTNASAWFRDNQGGSAQDVDVAGLTAMRGVG